MEQLNIEGIPDYSIVEGVTLLKEATLSGSKAPSKLVLQNGSRLLEVITFQHFLVEDVAKSLEGQVVCVELEHGIYKGNPQFTLKSIRECPTELGFTVDNFLPSLNLDANWKEFSNILVSSLRENFLNVFKVILQHPKIKVSLKGAYAANKMHDAIRGGLVHHKTKMLKIAKVVISNEEELELYKDIILLGIAFHDLGKCIEIDSIGNYHEGSILGHRVIMAGILFENKNEILKHISEDDFNYLIDIVIGHHGAYEDKPNFIVTEIVHLIDMLDSRVTSMFDRIRNGTVETKNGRPAFWDNNYGKYLFF